jgi:hypothetical protein
LVDEAKGIGLLGADYQPRAPRKHDKNSGSVSVDGPRGSGSKQQQQQQRAAKLDKGPRGQRGQAFDVGAKATLSVRAAPMVHTVKCTRRARSQRARRGCRRGRVLPQTFDAPSLSLSRIAP